MQWFAVLFLQCAQQGLSAYKSTKFTLAEIKQEKFNPEASDSKKGREKGTKLKAKLTLVVLLFTCNQHRIALPVLYPTLSERAEHSESLYIAFGPVLIPLLCRRLKGTKAI